MVAPADLEKLKYLRLNMNHPSMRPSPILHLDQLGVLGGEFEVKMCIRDRHDRGLLYQFAL